jgi:predicted dehydrogenase
MQEHGTIPRRHFLGGAAAAALCRTGLALAADSPASPPVKRKIKVGIVGCGGRGSWLAELFRRHGGYEFVAAADYFQDRADKTGALLGVDKKCFSGLSAYKRLIESGAEAVILETPPYFFPEHAAAAVEAGLHVFMAKPVAVDAPGALKIGALGEKATRDQRVFLVDYQMWTDPVNQEVYRRIRAGGLGTLQMVFSVGAGGGGCYDPPLTGNLADRLTNQIWTNDDALSCGHIGIFDVHVIDALIWALGRRPVSAYAKGGRFRKDPHGDAFDTDFVTYVFEDGLAWNHQSARGPTHDWLKQAASLEGSIQGSDAVARLSYWGKAYLRGGPKHFGGGQVADLYDAGAKRNIATFYANILGGDFGNQTALRSVDCTLTCILGREAARRGTLVTMDQVIKENKRLEIDLKGLKT